MNGNNLIFEDQKPYTDLAKRAKRMNEDPFMSEAEINALAGDTKEKQKDIDRGKGDWES